MAHELMMTSHGDIDETRSLSGVADVTANDAHWVCIMMALGGAPRILCVIPLEGGTKILGAPSGVTAIRCISLSDGRADDVVNRRNGSSY